MIRICYFASMRERLGLAEEQIEPEASIHSIETLKTHLRDRGSPWDEVLGSGDYLIARNQTIINQDETVTDGDEIAFFPQVTGG